MRRPRVLVLGAWEPEIAPLRALARLLARRTRGPRLLLEVTGVGLVDAALGADGAVERAGLDGARGDVCLFVGTAGLYARGGRRIADRDHLSAAPSCTPGRAVLGRHVHLASAAVARAEGYWPGPLIRSFTCDEGLAAAVHAAAPSLPVVDVATTLAITTTPALARKLTTSLTSKTAPPLPLVENLEAFAVARACQRRGVAFAAVLGISNFVGPSAHEEWKRLAKTASENVAAALTSWLEPGRRRSR